jgi:hypothetical protein
MAGYAMQLLRIQQTLLQKSMQRNSRTQCTVSDEGDAKQQYNDSSVAAVADSHLQAYD